MSVLARIHSIDDFRTAAQARLPRMVFDFLDGAAGGEATARDNRAAFEHWRLLPKALVDVSQRSLAVDLFGAPAAMPLIIGPTGLAAAYWPEGDCALARAAARHGIPFVMANGASAGMDEVARASTGRRWFQLYLPPQREAALPWLQMAEQQGFEALELTVDTAVPGRRLRDLRHGFALPFRWTPRKLLDVARKPRWALRMLRHGVPRARLSAGAAPPRAARSVSETMSARLSATLSWDDLAWLRDRWRRPLIVKGLSDAAQAAPLRRLGVDGVVVSNHGGRQLDGGLATLDALPAFVAELGGHMPILIDGGFRSGADIVKALALGATAVQLGRATLYALATAGEAGVDHALALLRQELDTTLALCGARSPRELGPHFLTRPGPQGPALALGTRA